MTVDLERYDEVTAIDQMLSEIRAEKVRLADLETELTTRRIQLVGGRALYAVGGSDEPTER